MTTKTKEFSDILKFIDSAPNLKFEKLSTLTEMPDIEPWVTIKKLNLMDGLIYKATSAIMNGVVSNKKRSFIFSRRILEELLGSMQSEETITLCNKQYKKVLAQLTNPENSFMVCKEKPTKGNSPARKAGLYEIKFDPLLKYLSSHEVSHEVSHEHEHEHVSEDEHEHGK